MNPAKLTALGLAALAMGSCTYPDFDFGPMTMTGDTEGMIPTRPVGGAGGAGGTSGTGEGVGSGVASSSSSTTAVSSSSSTGSGPPPPGCEPTHMGGGECEYLPGSQCGCSSTEKCSVTNESTGQSSCILAGSLGTAQKCTSDGSCQAGSWCDHFTETCAKICSSTSPCPQGGKCIQAVTVNSIAIPSLQICTANCDPITASPCGPSVTCEFDTTTSVLAFDCFASGLKTEGQACTASVDCNKGLVCRAATSTCERWCTPPGSAFPATPNNCSSAKPTCAAFSNHPTHNGVEYGVCIK